MVEVCSNAMYTQLVFILMLYLKFSLLQNFIYLMSSVFCYKGVKIKKKHCMRRCPQAPDSWCVLYQRLMYLRPCLCVAVIPKVTKHLLSNPVFTCIILAACMEIAVVAGFAAFLAKYLEQQFNLTTTSANQLLGRSPHTRTRTHAQRRDKRQLLCFSLSDRRSVFFRRYDCHSVRVSGDLHGRPAGEEAQPVGAGSHPHGHAGQPDLHRVLRLLPVPGLRHGPRGGGHRPVQ